MVASRDLVRFSDTQLSKRPSSLLAIEKLRDLARLDVGREVRKGLPEVILAEGKDAQEVAEIVEAMVKRTGRAIVSRANTNHLRKIRARRISNVRVKFFPKSGMIVIKRGSYEFRSSGGRGGLLTAGTSDIPIAEEARIIADEVGCGVGAGLIGGVIENRAAKGRRGRTGA